MKPYWKVGDIAKLTGLTIRTLHFYDQIGLFSPSGQSDSGHRLYHESDLPRLHQILSLKELGLSLEEVKAVLDGGQISPLDVMYMQMDRIKQHIRQQQTLLEQLGHVVKHMQGDHPPSVEDFTALLQTMKTEFVKPFIERQTTWAQHLDRLGELLAQKNVNGLNNEEESP
ncbi:MerR family transcriptional regulator [Paenibacillus athensensis]|uniref:MerR family transcriptional regulator n=1 Tax=Paenibacillus athensensis TaxID=1967502 RepID=A0A4Y8Q1R8_9BACL|nr:MerR family transcriptional regulator [Paenibacillus athensensis]MCD1260963.1 MerR family transcriptional regulator [Paenibacillus athensensis]